MRRLAGYRPSPSMVISLIALFVALGGTSYAALKVNSVGSKQLKKNAVTTAKIKNNAVNGVKVADGSLAGVDIADSSLSGVDVTDGSLTGADVKDSSLTGAELTDGSLALADLASNSVDGSKVVNGSLKGEDVAAGTFLGGKVTAQFQQAPADLADGASQSYNVSCPAGQVALGGGGRGDATQSEQTILTNTRPAISESNTEPPGDGQTFSGWRITIVNPAGGDPSGIKPEVWVICAAL